MKQRPSQLAWGQRLVQRPRSEVVRVERLQSRAFGFIRRRQSELGERVLKASPPVDVSAAPPPFAALGSAIRRVGRLAPRIAPVREYADAHIQDAARFAALAQRDRRPADGVGSDVQSQPVSLAFIPHRALPRVSEDLCKAAYI